MAWLFGGADVEQHDAAHVVLIDEAACCWRGTLDDIGAVVSQRVGGKGAAEAVAAGLEALQVNHIEVLREDGHLAEGRQLDASGGDGIFLNQFESFFAEGHALFLVSAVSYERGCTGASSRVKSWSCFSGNREMLPPVPTYIGVSRLVFSLRVPRLVGTL
ncbi:hypothetical protein D3C79_817690 [compost metagenome]